MFHSSKKSCIKSTFIYKHATYFHITVPFIQTPNVANKLFYGDKSHENNQIINTFFPKILFCPSKDWKLPFSL